jgi:hypothetical protein
MFFKKKKPQPEPVKLVRLTAEEARAKSLEENQREYSETLDLIISKFYIKINEASAKGGYAVELYLDQYSRRVYIPDLIKDLTAEFESKGYTVKYMKESDGFWVIWKIQ